MKKEKIAITLGIVCLLLTYGIAIQIKTVENSNSAVSQTLNDNSLRDEVLKYKEKYDNKYQELEEAEKVLETLRENASQKDSTLAEKKEQIQTGNDIAGLTQVTGPGVIVTLNDNQTGKSENVSDDLVHDLDVLNVINELKNAGAEAISINDQRLIWSSSIVCGGNIIEINGEKVGTPFEIKAIGLPEQLAGITRPGGYIDILNSYGISTKVEKQENITIPKYTGVINFNYAETIK